MTAEFIHLRNHTEYSLSDGLLTIGPLIDAVKRLDMCAVAITDRCNFFGAIQFYQAAMKAGVKPIIGSDIFLANPKQPDQPHCLTLLCQNNQGYKNLTCLISRAYLDGQATGKPVIEYAWLEEFNAGLLVLSGAMSGDVGRALLSESGSDVSALVQFWQRVFPNRYYLELQRVGREFENAYINKAKTLALHYDLPVVATNDVEFLARDDFEAHEARVCIHNSWQLSDSRRPRLFTEQQYLRSGDEMRELFADIPAAIINTVEIAKRCTVDIVLGKTFLPNFPVPAGMSIEEFLTQSAQTRLEKRLRHIFPEDPASHQFILKRKAYDERLAIELAVINGMGFAGYFLIVADFIQWARDHGVPVGPGRGSGAGSLVAYALWITNLDPLQHDLLFERFLNPERVSMPDFDIDFCMEGRDRVIDYVATKYGRDSVSQIITFGTMAAKAVVRDVGRVLGFPYGFVDTIAKLVPFELGMTLTKALEQEETLRERYHQEDDVAMLIDLALKLEGITRNAGKHAGGVVIAPTRLTDFAPLYCEFGSKNVVTQFPKDDVESIGLVKFDFLGLRTLTIIDWALQNVNKRRSASGEAPVDIDVIPMDDPDTFQLLQSCLTTAVFQLEGRGMKELVKRLQPDCFEHIVALVALFRPGPLQSGMVDDFIDRKHGRAIVRYAHPELEPILRNTLGVIIYQEQVMQIARVMAGYSLGKADILRRAMGKKKPEEMALQREVFVSGAVNRGIDEPTATHVFDLMEKFAGYGFNKSHSAAYALLAYQTAWLKAHFPAAFMAAVLSSDMDNTDKVVVFIDDCRQMKLTVLPPDINSSFYKFTVNLQDELVYGLGAIKGVGEAAMSLMIAEREARGPFSSLVEFCARLDLRKINKRVLEALVKSGAMDCFDKNRATLFTNIDNAVQAAEQFLQNKTSGQSDLFADTAVRAPVNIRWETAKSWRDEERLLAEKESLGFYLTGHPILRYKDELKKFSQGPIANLHTVHQKNVTIAGLIVAVRVLNTKRGDRMAFLTLDDSTARIELVVFSDAFALYKHLLIKDSVVVVEGEISPDEFSGGFKMSCTKIYDILGARERHVSCLTIEFSIDAMKANALKTLQTLLAPYRGGACPVEVVYAKPGAKAKFLLGENWKIKPVDDLLQSLVDNFSQKSVRLKYDAEKEFV